VIDRRLLLTWAGLVLATVVSWWLGGRPGSVVPAQVAAGLILVVAYVKIWFVGVEFMELRSAPPWLRRAFTTWLILVGGTTVALAVLL
jgi:hypothetical protein